MMKALIIFFCFSLIFISCKKSNQSLYQRAGVITGYDARMCPSPACGGLLITLKNDTAKNPPPFYHINSTLTQLGISENTKFPINVSLNYKPDTGLFAKYNYIIISQIMVIK